MQHRWAALSLIQLLMSLLLHPMTGDVLAALTMLYCCALIKWLSASGLQPTPVSIDNLNNLVLAWYGLAPLP